MKDIIKITIIMLIIDYIYLKYFGGPPFVKMVEKIQKEKFKINYNYVAIVYLLLVIIMYKYIIYTPGYHNSFVIGSIVYGVFDFTNMALFNNYQLNIAIQDSLWGGVLFTLTKFIFNKFNNY
jgi:uncharacterized membrane protein